MTLPALIACDVDGTLFDENETITPRTRNAVLAAVAAGAYFIVATGRPPRELRFLRGETGLVAFLTLGLDGESSLDEAHACASRVEERIRREQPEIDDVIVHTEP